MAQVSGIEISHIDHPGTRFLEILQEEYGIKVRDFEKKFTNGNGEMVYEINISD